MYPPMRVSDVSILELLKCDLRPTFVVATSPFESSQPVYVNPALRENAVLHDRILQQCLSSNGSFWDWIVATDSSASTPPSESGTRPGDTFLFGETRWTRSIVGDKWAVVGGNVDLSMDKVSHGPASHSRGNSSSLLHETTGHGAMGDVNDGWVTADFMSDQESFVHLISTINWAATPLGPLPRWPALLQQTFNQVLADSRPIVIYWGDNSSTLYNEAFSKLCGSKHPALLGKSVEDAWPDFREKIKLAMSTTASKHHAGDEDEWRFFVEKADGSHEEKYLKWSMIPIIEKNKRLGFIQPIQDTTSMRLWERRTKMLIDLGDMLVTARDVKSYWAKLLQELEACQPTYDIPLAILYSVDKDSQAPSKKGGKACRLEGCLGVPDGHPIAPPELQLDGNNRGLSSSFRKAFESQNPLLLQTRDGTLPESLLEGLRWRGFMDPCREAVICPIRPTKEENVLGLLVLGLNPRRPYDNDYRQYISLLGQKLTTTLASTVLLEEEARRGRNIAEQAAYDQAMLKEKLTMQTREATESVQKFQQIAEFIPVGMCFGNHRGNITFANDAWHRITGAPQVNPLTPEGFLSCVIEEDKTNVQRAYDELSKTLSVTIEFRVRRPIEDGYPLQHPIGSSPSFEKAGLDLDVDDGGARHVLASLKAERGPDGSIDQVLACLTDVTLHKKAAEEAIRKAQQAENLKRMAELATVGMYDMALDGRLIGANNVFYEMCGLERVDISQISVKPFETCVVDEDLPTLKKTLARLVEEGRSQTAEIRLKTQWTETDNTTGDQITAPRWVLATFMPVSNSEGIIQTFMGCLSDVSLQKWQFEKERQRKDEAIESKRQQENFVDMTSHEMRNPLSAIVQCADAVIGCLTRAQELADTQSARSDCSSVPKPSSVIDSSTGVCQEGAQLLKDSIDNAETIIACAQHQKRIVDDILTMSKLDSNLLSITPITVNPIHIAQEAFKMFEVEARRVDIDLTMVVDRSYSELNIEFLDLDPSRLKQVLINLLTNALKFTKNGPTRNVSITMSASKARPEDGLSSVQFIPRATDVTWHGDKPSPPVPEQNRIYLMFEVKDTGQGLTEEEKSSLFQRFVQANSKTHVKYGGSGLGLFISRRLTEMQHGAIGVASSPGQGSTFAFYIEAQVPSEEAFREARAAAEAVGHILKTPSSTAGKGLSRGPFTMAKQTKKLLGPQIEGVLLVEDNLINQQITRRELLTSGCAVEVANHGVEALEKLEHTTRASGQFPLSIILMDIEMPIQDGLSCTKKIRELEKEGHFKGPRIPIIAVSANARMEQILEAKDAGCDDVLVKPFRIPELIEKMMTVTKQLEKA
ncbi:hypothetical protein GGR54DRAFT_209317 [Hypoxylon sp. NC1633]|nr:hypothetical protein GGR54DRAFT_209317 [Hypoxylon sp. NC1633]